MEKTQQKDKPDEKFDDEEDADDTESDKLSKDSVQLFNAKLNTLTNKYAIKRVGTRINRKKFDIHPYSMLCTELKQLYVAITRPKNRLIIYDENSQSRHYIEKFWRNLNIVQTVTRADLNTAVTEENKDVASFRSLVVQTSGSEWRKQGIRMFKNKHYKQAVKCFEKSGDKELRVRALAYQVAEQTSLKTSEVNAKTLYMKEGYYPYNTYNKTMRKNMKIELKKQRTQCKKDFLQAAQLFETIKLFKQAAQCYFSAEKYQKALAAYEQIGHIKQAAEASFMLKDYQKAAEYYNQSGNYVRAIECLAEIRQYESILQLIDRTKTIPTDQRESYAKKYIPLALKALLVNVDYNIEDFDDKKEEEKQSNELKNQKIEEVSEDEEEDEEENNSDRQDTNEDEGNNNDQDGAESKEEGEEADVQNSNDQKVVEDHQSPVESEVVAANKLETNEGKDMKSIQHSIILIERATKDIQSVSFSEIEIGDSRQTVNIVEKDQSELSFEVISGTKSKNTSVISFGAASHKAGNLKAKQKTSVDEMSFQEIDSSNLKDKNLDDFGHLSRIDLDDEWLRMEGGSVVEQLSTIRRETSHTGTGTYSEYSAVDLNLVIDSQYTLVKTKTDIIVQDAVMRKIISYISMFSEDVKQSLSNLRSKKTLLSQKDDEITEENAANLMIDLDEISSDFIYLILDLLEHYKLHKLCIFVCNRYGLSQKLGRYLVNIGARYSNFAVESIIVNKFKLNNGIQRQIQSEKAFVANVAFHNVLENINPSFLRLKKKGERSDSSNSLGNECYSELINLGLWKKCLFLMDYQNAIALASTFASFKNYRLIYSTENESTRANNTNNVIAGDNFEFLPFDTPKTLEDMSCSFVALEAVIWDLMEKLPLYIQNELLKGPELPDFPSFFPLNKALWNYMFNKHDDINFKPFKQGLSGDWAKFKQILHSRDAKSLERELHIYDQVTFLVQLVLLYNKIPEIGSNLTILDDSKFEELINVLNNLIILTQDETRIFKYHETIIRALITPFRVRVIEDCQVLDHMSASYFITHTSSSLVPDILDYRSSLNTDPSVSPVMVDLEGSFIAVPINIIMSSVRKRLVIIPLLIFYNKYE